MRSEPVRTAQAYPKRLWRDPYRPIRRVVVRVRIAACFKPRAPWIVWPRIEQCDDLPKLSWGRRVRGYIVKETGRDRIKPTLGLKRIRHFNLSPLTLEVFNNAPSAAFTNRIVVCWARGTICTIMFRINACVNKASSTVFVPRNSIRGNHY